MKKALNNSTSSLKKRVKNSNRDSIFDSTIGPGDMKELRNQGDVKNVHYRDENQERINMTHSDY